MILFSVIKRSVEFFVNIPLFIRIARFRQKECTWLFLSPQYLNYGDHLIALSETEFISARGTLVDVNFSFFECWGKRIVDCIKKHDIIWITGGGYLGDLWTKSHEAVEEIIKLFPDNIIIIAPQSLFYYNYDCKEAKQFSDLVNKHGKCFFFARESNTVNRLSYLGIDSVLVPDFGLLTNQSPNRNYTTCYISFCFRDDHESQIIENKALLKALFTKYDLPFHDISMAKKHYEIPTWTRKFFVNRKIKEYSKSLFVVTDRLHGMIFCCIAGVPCVALDNKSNKISGVYEWIKDLRYIAYADSMDSVEEKVSEVMNYSDKKENKESFAKLRKKLDEQYYSLFEKYVL